ncbi:MAG: hypothetical protein C4547_09385 [Phycisphaerales bacterium]|nr:MAG: hypothetical protein C4547_09385 [Phycisphaerales bacterium]
MHKWLNVLLRLAVVAFVVMTAERVLHRDPCAQVSDGSSIVATHWGGPCFLNYETCDNERAYSMWLAMTSTTIDDFRNRETGYLFLDSDGAGDWLKFDTPEAWEAARRARNTVADWDVSHQVSGITRCATIGDFVVGTFDSGCFILDISENAVLTLDSESEWKRAVQSQAGAPAGRLRDPKSWFVQSRAPAVWAVMAAIALGSIPSVIAPLRRDRPPAFEVRQERAGKR